MTARAVQERLNAAGFGPLTVDGNIGPATLASLDRALSGVAKTPASTPQSALASGIKFLTIHCAATPRGRDVKAATVADIGRQRFGQPSYHHVVELDGNTVRLLRDDQKGAHVGGQNTSNIGICYVGGVEDNKAMTPADTRTDAQKAALRKVVAEYRARYPGIIVRGHRDWPGVAKACPSFDVATAL